MATVDSTGDCDGLAEGEDTPDDDDGDDGFEDSGREVLPDDADRRGGALPASRGILFA